MNNEMESFEYTERLLDREETVNDVGKKQFFWNKPEKTVENQEITNRLKNVGIREVHLEGVLEDWQSKMTSSVENMCEKYPELVGNIGTIRARKLPEGVFACAGPTMNSKNGYSTELQVNIDKFSKANLEWKIVDMEKENRFGEKWSSGQGLDGVMKHEMGHLLHLGMIAHEEGLQPGELNYDKYSKLTERFGHNAIAANMCFDATRELGISSKDVGRELSTYAKKDLGEFFAESIGEYESSKTPRRLATRVHEKYEEYIKNNNIRGEDTIDVSKELRNIVENNVIESVLPKRNGTWEGAGGPGNSEFVLNDNAAICYRDKASSSYASITGAKLKQQMLEQYGVDRVTYEGNEPDFSIFEDSLLGHVELEDFSIDRDGKDGTFHKAQEIVAERNNMKPEEVKQYMKEHNLTWHECGDCKIVRAVPTVINAAYKHTGGISIERSKVAIADTLKEKYGSMRLQRENISASVDSREVSDSKKAAQRAYIENKRNL